MLEHTHTGTEMTCVLTGSFSHEAGHYGPGDFDLGDESVNHNVGVPDRVKIAFAWSRCMENYDWPGSSALSYSHSFGCKTLELTHGEHARGGRFQERLSCPLGYPPSVYR